MEARGGREDLGDRGGREWWKVGDDRVETKRGRGMVEVGRRVGREACGCVGARLPWQEADREGALGEFVDRG